MHGVFPSSVWTAFGPSYHLLVNPDPGKDDATWFRIPEGDSGPEVWDDLLKDYQSIMDYPAAIFGRELYAAYPDAKFILVAAFFRDPQKWEESMKSSLLLVYHALANRPNNTPGDAAFVNWYKTFVFDKYHEGRLETHAQQELMAHNERIRNLIPSHRLLVYDVSEGWDRLTEFLGV
ncbi:hypothetical protein BU17DRAFT_90840 [Hysterangium stoloniferum]|nr:hypothetical protein BU17DRAFT_90840 [Hysterangium stoloniferum]